MLNVRNVLDYNKIDFLPQPHWNTVSRTRHNCGLVGVLTLRLSNTKDPEYWMEQRALQPIVSQLGSSDGQTAFTDLCSLSSWEKK